VYPVPTIIFPRITGVPPSPFLFLKTAECAPPPPCSISTLTSSYIELLRLTTTFSWKMISLPFSRENLQNRRKLGRRTQDSLFIESADRQTPQGLCTELIGQVEDGETLGPDIKGPVLKCFF
jgi:hypothetical protein